MASIARRRHRGLDLWPGYVDALASLLIVVMFLLLVFVLAQFFLGEALSGRDEALRWLRNQVDELAELLSLERGTSEDLRRNVERLSEQLQASLAERDELRTSVTALSQRARGAEDRVEDLAAGMAEAKATIDAGSRTITEQAEQLAKLSSDIAALSALKRELEEEVKALGRRAGETQQSLIEERQLAESARAQVALLNQQMAALRQQLEQLNAALEASEQKTQAQQAEILTLGQRLNAALAGRVQELARYRSEFFGRLREVLGDQPSIRIVGDRFVFQSEVLFASGSAELDAGGRNQLQRVAELLKDLQTRIPEDLPWVIQVNGHTDRRPINTPDFASNRELSLARALSVVNLLVEYGIPPQRLAAAGFGEFQPLETEESEEAYRRNRRIELQLTRP
jgi:chemotaxis protein MotB